MPGSKVVIGRVARPRGIAGEVKIEPLTDDPRRFLSLKNVYVGGVTRKVVKAQVTPAGVFVALEGVGDRNAAETLRGALLEVERKDAVKPEGRQFIADLIGCEVRLQSGRAVGVLSDILQYGAADVYVVKAGKKTVMFPALKRLFVCEDPESGVIVLDDKAFDEVAVYED